MNLLNEIAQLLITQNIVETGEIFASSLPDSPNNAIMMLNSPSPEADKDTPIKFQVIDFWSRNEVWSNGYDKVKQIYDFLHQKANYSTTSFYIYFGNAITNIEDLGKDANGRKLNKLSIKFQYRELESIS